MKAILGVLKGFGILLLAGLAIPILVSFMLSMLGIICLGVAAPEIALALIILLMIFAIPGIIVGWICGNKKC